LIRIYIYIYIYILTILSQTNLPPAPEVIAPAIVNNVQQQAQMEAALMRLGLLKLAAREFTGNGINTLHRLCTLSEDALGRLIKQIHRDNQDAGLFLPLPHKSISMLYDSGLTVCISLVVHTILKQSMNP